MQNPLCGPIILLEYVETREIKNNYRKSNLNNYAVSTHKVSKRSRKFRSPAEVQAYLEKLAMMQHVRMNPYKVVKMWINYPPPNVHHNFYDNEL